MPRLTSKQRRQMRVSARQIRRKAKRTQLRIRKTTLEMKQVVSQRGRTGWMEAPMPGMPTEPQELLLDSTAIRRFKYDITSKILHIWFVKGGSYDYFDVPESVVMTLSQAQSKGRYFYYNIRTTYKFQKVS